MQNKLDMLFQPSWVSGRPNHSMMEYFLLSWCNYKARLDGSKACHLACIPGQIVEVGLSSRDMIWFTKNSPG